MNKDTRKEIAELMDKATDLAASLRSIQERIAEIASDEDDKFNNLPEGIQMSERGQAIEEAAGILTEQADEMDSAIDTFFTAQEALQVI
jgi:hypothetical protein